MRTQPRMANLVVFVAYFQGRTHLQSKLWSASRCILLNQAFAWLGFDLGIGVERLEA